MPSMQPPLPHALLTAAPAPLEDPARDRRARLLVVDDQALNIQAIHAILDGAYDLHMAKDGEKALELSQRIRPDLILLDVAMPGMSGLDVCRRLRLLPDTRDVPVIFVTAPDQPEQENACWEAGGVDFVTKPVNAVTLRNRVRVHLTLKFQTDMLRQMAFLDGLTGVANRRQFDERLELEWRRGARAGTPLSLIAIDVDHFKFYNDHYGHQKGDDCLRAIAAILASSVQRPGDLIARYGGEEFVCLLPETDLAGAHKVALRLEAGIRAAGITHEASSVAPVVTASLGVACLMPDQLHGAEALLKRADALLYRAKRDGRGQVAIEEA